jgi:hypothetical protein
MMLQDGSVEMRLKALDFPNTPKLSETIMSTESAWSTGK